MNQLEKTIFELIEHEYHVLDSLKNDELNSDFSSSWHRLSGLLQIAHVQDSGLSEQAFKSILSLESKANRIIALNSKTKGDNFSYPLREE